MFSCNFLKKIAIKKSRHKATTKTNRLLHISPLIACNQNQYTRFSLFSLLFLLWSGRVDLPFSKHFVLLLIMQWLRHYSHFDFEIYLVLFWIHEIRIRHYQLIVVSFSLAVVASLYPSFKREKPGTVATEIPGNTLQT